MFGNRSAFGGHSDLYEAIRRGEDYTREQPGATLWPYPTIVGSLTTFAPLTNDVLRFTGAFPAPTDLAGAGQYGVLPKDV